MWGKGRQPFPFFLDFLNYFFHIFFMEDELKLELKSLRFVLNNNTDDEIIGMWKDSDIGVKDITKLLRSKKRYIIRVATDVGIKEWWVYGFNHRVEDTGEIMYKATSTYVQQPSQIHTITFTVTDKECYIWIMTWIRLYSESITGRMGYAPPPNKDIEISCYDAAGVEIEKYMASQCNPLGFNDDDEAPSTLELRPRSFVKIF